MHPSLWNQASMPSLKNLLDWRKQAEVIEFEVKMTKITRAKVLLTPL